MWWNCYQRVHRVAADVYIYTRRLIKNQRHQYFVYLCFADWLVFLYYVWWPKEYISLTSMILRPASKQIISFNFLLRFQCGFDVAKSFAVPSRKFIEMKWEIHSRFSIFRSPIVCWSFVLNGPLSLGSDVYRTRTVGGHTHFMTDFSFSPSLIHFLLLELQNEILVCFVYRRSHSLNATYVPRMCNVFFHWLYLILLDEYRMQCGIELRVRHWRRFFPAEFRATFHDLMGPRMNAISQSQWPQLTIGWPKDCVGCGT